MFNSVQFVRELCKTRGIAISQLEKECGFSNGYLNPKKMQKLPYDRALTIARYLDITVEEILTGKKETPAESKRVSEEAIKFALFRGREDITDAMYEEVLRFADFVARREEEKRKE